MRYEIKYWKFDDDEKYLIICKTKNEVISQLSYLFFRCRIEDIKITDLKTGGHF